MTGKLMRVACWKCSLKHEYLECSKRNSFADGRKHVCLLFSSQDGKCAFCFYVDLPLRVTGC